MVDVIQKIEGEDPEKGPGKITKALFSKFRSWCIVSTSGEYKPFSAVRDKVSQGYLDLKVST